ncbi:MAG TPA: VOC family protein [Bacillota bacterium]|nr:VOC family protein [Bacillota bacterium]
MSDKPTPTSMNGAICYLEIPATDPEGSAQFYHGVFGWSLRRHDDGAIAFDDNVATSRRVSGMWVTGRSPLREAGIVISIMVDDAEKTVESIIQHGGEIVRPLGFNPHERIAWFRDPGGNILGIYQEP